MILKRRLSSSSLVVNVCVCRRHAFSLGNEKILDLDIRQSQIDVVPKEMKAILVRLTICVATKRIRFDYLQDFNENPVLRLKMCFTVRPGQPSLVAMMTNVSGRRLPS